MIGIAAGSSEIAHAVDIKCIGVVVKLGEKRMWYVAHYFPFDAAPALPLVLHS